MPTILREVRVDAMKEAREADKFLVTVLLEGPRSKHEIQVPFEMGMERVKVVEAFLDLAERVKELP